MGESEAETIRQPRDRLKEQPQERQHRAAKGGTRDRLLPARGATFTRMTITLYLTGPENLPSFDAASSTGQCAHHAKQRSAFSADLS